jgi:hypothetical protein
MSDVLNSSPELPWIVMYSIRFNEKIKSILEIQQAEIVSLGRPDDPVSLFPRASHRREFLPEKQK